MRSNKKIELVTMLIVAVVTFIGLIMLANSINQHGIELEKSAHLYCYIETSGRPDLSLCITPEAK